MASMILTIDPITRQKLYLVKQLYQHAEVQSYAYHSAVNRIMAVIGFDLTIETALKVVVSALEKKDQPDKTFDGLIQQANDKLAKAGYNGIPDEGTIRRVHDTRNHAQHKATYPNETDVGDCRTYTRDFLQKLIPQLWGITIEGISLTDLVNHPQIKQLLVEAQDALSKGECTSAIVNANAGLSLAIVKARRKFFRFSGSRLRSSSSRTLILNDTIFPNGLNGEIWSGLVRLDKKMQGYFRETVGLILGLRRDVIDEMTEIEEIQLCSLLSMNYSDFLQFRKIAGITHFFQKFPVS